MVISAVAEDRQFTYDESLLSGKKRLFVDGEEATKLSKNSYSIKNSGETVTVKGNALFGVTLYIQEKEIVLHKNKWYEWIFIVLPLLYLSIGVLGGAIGGGLSGLFAAIAAMTNASLLRSNRNIVLKIVLCVVSTVVFFAVWFGIYLVIAGGLAAAFPTIFDNK